MTKIFVVRSQDSQLSSNSGLMITQLDISMSVLSNVQIIVKYAPKSFSQSVLVLSNRSGSDSDGVSQHSDPA
jgi:hypothetical protein